MENLENWFGRQWVKDDEMPKTTNIIIVPAVIDGKCQRCGSQLKFQLPNRHFYCRGCLNIGRLDDHDQLVRLSGRFSYPLVEKGGLVWQGQLTLAQKQVAKELVASFELGRNHLVRAVTGAGKTEMLFMSLAACLAKGKRACVASPRIDVVNELFPRLKAAFAVPIGKYHGREYHAPANEQLIVCTAHQLFKFYRAFDLLIIDEVDAFPFRGEAKLHFAAHHAVKLRGATFFLTATPDQELLHQVTTKQIGYSMLTRRFHGGLLPVPEQSFFLRPFLRHHQLNPRLRQKLTSLIVSGKPILVFVPHVSQVALYTSILKKVFQNRVIASVHANDPKRQEKVQAFRDGKSDLLVTTTILERGVTFKKVWVIVIGADHEIFDTATLIQIAGRVGRSKTDSQGRVLFCYHQYTKAIYEAIRQIKAANQ